MSSKIIKGVLKSGADGAGQKLKLRDVQLYEIKNFEFWPAPPAPLLLYRWFGYNETEFGYNVRIEQISIIGFQMGYDMVFDICFIIFYMSA